MNNRIVIEIGAGRANIQLPPTMTPLEGVEKLLAAAHYLTTRAMQKSVTPSGLIVPGGISGRTRKAMAN